MIGFLLTGSSLGLLNCARYGWRRAYWALILFLGLNCSILMSRSKASVGVSFLNHSFKGLTLLALRESIMVAAT